jgi:hypothetical protein
MGESYTPTADYSPVIVAHALQPDDDLVNEPSRQGACQTAPRRHSRRRYRNRRTGGDQLLERALVADAESALVRIADSMSDNARGPKSVIAILLLHTPFLRPSIGVNLSITYNDPSEVRCS